MVPKELAGSMQHWVAIGQQDVAQPHSITVSTKQQNCQVSVFSKTLSVVCYLLLSICVFIPNILLALCVCTKGE